MTIRKCRLVLIALLFLAFSLPEVALADWPTNHLVNGLVGTADKLHYQPEPVSHNQFLPPQSEVSASLMSENITPAPELAIPPIIIEPPDITWYQVEVGTPSLPVPVIVHNYGSSNLTTGNVTIEGPCFVDYSIQNDNISSRTIVPGTVTTLELVFTPQATGPRFATLVIQFVEPAIPPVHIELYGNKSFDVTPTDIPTPAPSKPQPDITVEPNPVDFRSVTVGSSRGSGLIRVINTGSDSLTVGDITIGGPDATDFSKKYDNAEHRTIPPGRYEFLQVFFKPSSAGDKSATLIVASNDPDEPLTVVELLGEALTIRQVIPASPVAPAPEPEPAPTWALLIGVILSGAVLISFLYLILKMDI